MRTLRIKVPTINDVYFTVSVEPEYTPVRGNYMASGNDAEDKQAEDFIINQLDNGNEWAWCCVKVTAAWKSLTGVDYLGGCSYNSESDFKQDGYFEDMKQRAFDDLITTIEALSGKPVKTINR